MKNEKLTQEQKRLKNNERSREWRRKNKERHAFLNKRWKTIHKGRNEELSKIWAEKKRSEGITYFCPERYKEVPGYEEAKANGFDNYEIHHVMENDYKSETLKKMGMYYDISPELLIWLPKEAHRQDGILSAHYPELTKWHQHRLDR